MIDIKFYNYVYDIESDIDINKHWNTIGKIKEYYPSIQKFYEDFPNFNYKKYAVNELEGIKKFLNSDYKNLIYQNFYDKNYFSYIEKNPLINIIKTYNKTKNNKVFYVDYPKNNPELEKYINLLEQKFIIKKVNSNTSIDELIESIGFINFNKNISKEYFKFSYKNSIAFLTFDYPENIIIKKNNYPFFFKTIKELFFLLEIIQSKKVFDIIVPCYNCEEYIQNNLKSLFSQTYKNFNIYLIDDCSKDNTLSIIKSIKNKSNPVNLNILINELNCGKYISINKIIKQTKGDFVLIVDSDDCIVQNRLLYDLINFSNNDDIYVSQTKYYRFDEETKNIILKPSYGENIVTFKKNIFDLIGFFYPTKFGGDTEFIERILKFLGKKVIKQSDIITYISIIKKDKSNLTKQISLDKRLEFVRKYRTIHENNGIDFFLKLFK